ncbi:hypothetical protein EJ05DRAFT_497803 [Pseudovirgaria hyperparasitica]|uniref:RRM domain-containing protein n=1 Tax=Pseudovirgaria hyperparasitica TaxID=470096 RepID=A0A6A6WEK5_9PEZI|nr:uncharacterized protein EJ05DRAFT_497803 [Pseudovirgaria hyperparasitica]KAF2761252.1 hypothetical protein EJ05DRAFT_497803 [Pseudovirgaria hyperparasitica]
MSATEVSSTRLYLGNLPRTATKADVESHFQKHGTGKITEIKLMNGFGFIEYEDAMDARDVVPAFHGSDFMGERLVVQFARGSRARNENFPNQERVTPRPRRTPFRMDITGLSTDTSWQDLKDFARQNGLDVVYSEVGRERDGKGFVEYETAADLRKAVEMLDNQEFKTATVRCVANTQEDRRSDRFRSRSPTGGRRPYGAPGDDYYDRRGPPGGRAYSPRADYRRRSPPPRDYYDRERYGRSPPRVRGPPEDYPPRRYPEDPYEPRVPPRGGYRPDPYANGHDRGYGRPLSPRGRPRSPPRAGYDDPYAARDPYARAPY